MTREEDDERAFEAMRAKYREFIQPHVFDAELSQIWFAWRKGIERGLSLRGCCEGMSDPEEKG